jgi:RecA/RadA recombinase
MAKKKKAAGKKKAKKPAKKKAAPKKKKAAKKGEKDDEVPEIRRQSMVEVVERHKELLASSAIMTPDQFAFFAFPRLFTGIIDIDLVLRPTIGKRVCLIGKPQMGKSLTAHVFTGAAHRTCRFCFRPIIEWLDEETGEIQPRCKCGKNVPMVVIHVDVEDSFDPWWAAQWGVHLEDRVYESNGYKYRKSENDDLYVVMPLNADLAFDFVSDAVRNGAADFVVIDSIAMMLPGEALENKKGIVGVGQDRVGSRARIVGQGLTKILNAQIQSHCKFGARSTVVWTNQYYQGPVKSVYEAVNKHAAGLKAKHAADHIMAFIGTVKEGDKAVRAKMGVRSLTINFSAEKSKSAGTGGASGKYKCYLDDYRTRYGVLSAGDTDEADRLYSYLSDLGFYKNEGTKEKPIHWCLGRNFKTVKDLVAFLSRDDIKLMARYFIYRELLPVSAKAYLEESDYDYSPFGKDKAFEIFGEKEPADEVPVPAASEGSGEKGDEKVEDWNPV